MTTEDHGDPVASEIVALTAQLHATERRLEELTRGEVDAVLDGHGGAFMLRRAQEQVRLRHQAAEAAMHLALSAQQTELRAVFDLMPALIWVKDANNGILRVNQGVADLAGLPIADIEGRPTEEIYPIDAARFYRDDLEVIHSRLPKLGIVEALATADGQTRWVLTDKVPVINKAGEVTGLVVMSRDITEQKRGEQAVIESNARFSGAFEDAPIGMAIVSPDGCQWLRVNRALCELLGYSEEEFFSHTVQDLTHPDDLAISGRNVHRALEDATSYQMEKRYLHKSGKVIAAVVSIALIRDSKGEPLYFVSHILDMTARKAVEEDLRDTSEKFRQLADNITDAFWIRSPDMKEVHYISPAFERIWGRTVESLRKNPHLWIDFVLSEDRAMVQAAFDSLTGDTKSVDLEYRIVLPNGEQRWVRARGFQVHDDAGTLVRILGIVTDITDKRRASERLRASEEDFRILTEAMPQIVWITEPDGRNIFFNQRWMDYTGMSMEESLGDGWRKPFHPDDQERAATAWSKAVKEIDVYSIEARIRRRDGVYRWWLVRGVPLKDTQGAIIKWIGTCTDIHDMKLAELEISHSNRELEVAADALRISAREQRQLASDLELERARLVAAQEVATVGSWEISLPSMASLWSAEMHHIFGTDPVSSIVTRLFFMTLVHPQDRHIVESAFSESVRQRGASSLEHRIVLKNGTLKYVEQRWRIVFDETQRPLRAIGTCQDITERKLADIALRRSQERIRDVFNGLGPSMFVGLMTPDGILVEINRAALEAANITASEVLGKHFADSHWFSHSTEVQRELRDAIARAVAGEASRYDVKMKGIGTELIDVDFSLQPLKDENGRIAFLVPSGSVITDRKRTEAALRKSQKLEAVGQLAAGVAHEFNNILQTLMSMAAITRLRGVNPEDVKNAEQMEVQIRRGASVTRQLLLASRNTETAKTTLDLCKEVVTVAELLRRLLPENIQMVVDTAPEPANVRGDSGQIQQVLLNLAINARDAMADGGTLTLRVCGGADEVSFDVEDSGMGFDEATNEHLFEPFFTTKEPGKGTGLGLAVVHGIVEQHGGRIEVHSEPGVGSRFRVILPHSSSGEARVEPVQKTLHRKAAGRILLVEDEEAVRDGLQLQLEHIGYEVVTAGRAEDALALPMSPAPDLLLTDVSLPGISGPSLAAQLRARWPELRVILMTGYVDDTTAANARHEAWQLIQKPFEMEELQSHLLIAMRELAPPAMH